MKARIKVQSYDTSMWKGMQVDERHETVHLVEKGETIHTVGLERPYEFKVADVRPGAVDLLVSPSVLYESSNENSTVGLVTLDVDETIKLKTMSLDAWGFWGVTLEGIV